MLKQTESRFTGGRSAQRGPLGIRAALRAVFRPPANRRSAGQWRDAPTGCVGATLSLPPIYEKLADLTQLYPHAGSFCFFTDTANLPTILREGCLFSRDEARRRGVIKLDCASAKVLVGTPAWVHKCVRLYFAPLTPMLYRVEGIKRTAD